jgi:16S rRNA (cytosine967-C5)-methyltransferase
MAAYQLFHMSVAPYAAVGQAVEQARSIGGRGGPALVNGVLRALGRAGEDPAIFPDQAGDPAGFLSSWHSHPRWLVERWLDRWSLKEVEALLEANNQVPSVYLRPLGDGVEHALDALGAGALAAGPGKLCVKLPTGMSPSDALARVRGIIQDPGAAVVTEYADVPSDWTVADLCAAPGGKAVALAESVRYVVAADRSAARLARLVETSKRLGSRLGIVVARAEAPPLTMARAVLLDVPCSGTGTLQRHPDLKWRLSPESIDSLVRAQREILEGASALVPAGGLLVYATCTLEPEENEEQVDAFLERHPDFAPASTRAVPAELLDEAGRLRVLPYRFGCDGAFAARLQRVV